MILAQAFIPAPLRLMPVALLCAACSGRTVPPPSVSQLAAYQVEQGVLGERYAGFYDRAAWYDSLSWRLAVGADDLCPAHAKRDELGFTYTSYRRWSARPNDPVRFIPSYVGMTVQTVVPGSPAARELEPGDVILSPTEIPAELQPGTLVTMEVWRGHDGQLPFTLTTEPDETVSVTMFPARVCPTVSFLRSDEAAAFTEGDTYSVTSAMAELVANEDEAAFVMAHELGHIIADHGAKRRRNSVIGTALGILADGHDDNRPDFTPPPSEALGDAGAAMFALEFEREADNIAVLVMARAGFDAEHGAELWKRLGSEGGMAYSARHPSYGSRYDNTVALARLVKECAGRVGGVRRITAEHLEICARGLGRR